MMMLPRVADKRPDGSAKPAPRAPAGPSGIPPNRRAITSISRLPSLKLIAQSRCWSSSRPAHGPTGWVESQWVSGNRLCCFGVCMGPLSSARFLQAP